ncbi:C6 transcription factor [Aspergillus karnatakaensis]|uniref:MFS transporter n=1 Tax=Aspergillus karnatakaensis TaxID=1810916 RepID=UPI003CCCD24F
MESYYQYQRIRQAVRQQIAALKEKCTCEGYEIGSSHDPSCLTDIDPTTHENPYIVVDWDGKNDPLKPANYSTLNKLFMTFLVSLIAVAVTSSSAIEACGLRQYSEYFEVSEVVGSLATALFLIGFSFGSLLSGPFSETFGRNAIYLSTMLLYLIFVMASGLAPNLHSHLVFRFIAGFFGSTPLSCAGGTVADLWNPVQKGYAFPLYAIFAFGGPMVGQIIGSFIPTTLGWRWLEWIMLIMGGAILCIVLLLQPETYSNLLLYWKAKILREETGDPILILMCVYLTVIYIVLFTFLEGYTYVFHETYGVSQGVTSLIWAGMLVGILLVSCVVPPVYSWTAKEYQKTGAIAPETRLWYAMLGGAPAVPISLFWMGWTSNPTISIWSPIVASALFGYGITTIFIVTYMYLIDSYDTYSASALGFLGFTRYLVAGGVTVAGGPIYRALGVQYTLTIMGSISAVLALIPYLFYIHGPQIRKHSKYAVNVDAA